MAEPKALVFDVGNVLVRLRTKEFLAALEAACPALTEKAMRRELYDDGSPHHAYERGQISGQQFHQSLVDKFALPWAYEQWLAVWNDYFMPNRPMEALLADLDYSTPCWALSNTNAEHLSTIKRNFRLFDRFMGFIASHECALRKPEPAIYEHSLKAMGLHASEIVFIDDLKANIEAAQDLGIRSFHYTFNDLELRAYLREQGLSWREGEGRKSAFAC